MNCFSQVYNSLSEYLKEIRYLYKSEYYAYEREYRILIPETNIDKSDIRFDEPPWSDDLTSPRHYYEDEDLEVEKIFDSKSVITLGPRVSNSYNMKYYIRSLLEKAELDGPTVKESQIPY